MADDDPGAWAPPARYWLTTQGIPAAERDRLGGCPLHGRRGFTQAAEPEGLRCTADVPRLPAGFAGPTAVAEFCGFLLDVAELDRQLRDLFRHPMAASCRHCGLPIGRVNGGWANEDGMLSCVKAAGVDTQAWRRGEGPVYHEPMPQGLRGATP